MQVKKIIVVFKTHLDIGFTDFASEVTRLYNEQFIPRAIAAGEEMLALGREEGFVWSTGSWLVHQYLGQANEQDRARACQAIKAGLLRWHALPYTMHSEVANADLYRHALSLSKELDAEFGVTTIASKCTDVPGHTRAIVPLLHEAKVEFLHIGVNQASTPPDVPDLFRWKAPQGEEITVMYAKGDYGEFAVLPNGTAVHFAHTGDNLGPPASAAEICEVYDKLREEYPGAEIRAGGLCDIARAVAEIADTLPMITQEIGDSWIHGAGTDPQKVSQYRALLRLAANWDEKSKQALYQHLMLVPEYTWGLDEKTHLRDNANYSRTAFEARREQPNYRKMEQSWQEQRDYVLRAVDALEGDAKTQAKAAIEEYKTSKPELISFAKVSGSKVTKQGWEFKFDSHGSVVGLQKDGVVYADGTHKLCDFLYEVFSEKEVLAFGDRYMTNKFDWALEDQGKIGLGPYLERYRSYKLRCDGIYENECDIVLVLRGEQVAAREFGCPPELILTITPTAEQVMFDLAWFNKPALRIPEALWMGFCLPKPLTGIQKLGQMIDPLDVISNGNREMHASEGLLEFEDLKLEVVDAQLIAVEKPSCYAFHNKIPDTRKGVWVNLFNNQWGTNFPMWNEGDARFRFVLHKK